VRSTPGRFRAGDVSVAAGLSLLLVTLVLVAPDGPAATPGLVVALLCAVVQGATVAFVRSWPEAAMAVAVAAGVGLEALAPGTGWLGQVAAVLACYTRRRTPRRSLWVLAVLVAATPWKLVAGDWRIMALAAAGPALGWSLGELGRTRALRRADQQRRIVLQERHRIARELHDVLTHTVSVIAVQAAAAEDVFDRRPDQARRALGTIATAARSTLAELRVLLHTMSADDRGEAGPQPGLAELGTLVTALASTGLRVELRADLREVPAAVGLSAYRIVQESLTNTLRHSQATHAEVVVRCEPEVLRLEIRDAGPARAVGRVSGSAHRGIVGMRERAQLLGGTLRAGPLPGGGFQVSADLPLEQAA
jgi:signal transduction histidine kinase